MYSNGGYGGSDSGLIAGGVLNPYLVTRAGSLEPSLAGSVPVEPGRYSIWSGSSQGSQRTSRSLDVPKALQVTYKSKTTTTGLFKRTKKESVSGSFQREIAGISGEWVNEFIPNNGKKGGGKLYVPSTAELLKRNIRRSWTISNPSGTVGPQMEPRAGNMSGPPPPHHPGGGHLVRHHGYPKPDLLPVMDADEEAEVLAAEGYGGPPPAGDHFAAAAAPLPARSRPVVVAQIPPPQRAGQHQQFDRPVTGQQGKRNVPVRSQSLGMADTNQFYSKGGMGPPRSKGQLLMSSDEVRGQRMHDPYSPRRQGQPIDLFGDASSEGEDAMMIDQDYYRSWDRRTNKPTYNQLHLGPDMKYASGSGGLDRRAIGDCQSLERRPKQRRLPDVPTHSLPRPNKQKQLSTAEPRNDKPDTQGAVERRSKSQESGSGGGAEHAGRRTQSQEAAAGSAELTGRRTHSQGEGIGDASRRRLPQAPGRDFREPTPDYDSSSSSPRQGRHHGPPGSQPRLHTPKGLQRGHKDQASPKRPGQKYLEDSVEVHDDDEIEWETEVQASSRTPSRGTCSPSVYLGSAETASLLSEVSVYPDDLDGLNLAMLKAELEQAVDNYAFTNTWEKSTVPEAHKTPEVYQTKLEFTLTAEAERSPTRLQEETIEEILTEDKLDASLVLETVLEEAEDELKNKDGAPVDDNDTAYLIVVKEDPYVQSRDDEDSNSSSEHSDDDNSSNEVSMTPLSSSNTMDRNVELPIAHPRSSKVDKTIEPPVAPLRTSRDDDSSKIELPTPRPRLSKQASVSAHKDADDKASDSQLRTSFVSKVVDARGHLGLSSLKKVLTDDKKSSKNDKDISIEQSLNRNIDDIQQKAEKLEVFLKTIQGKSLKDIMKQPDDELKSMFDAMVASMPEEALVKRVRDFQSLTIHLSEAEMSKLEADFEAMFAPQEKALDPPLALGSPNVREKIRHLEKKISRSGRRPKIKHGFDLLNFHQNSGGNAMRESSSLSDINKSCSITPKEKFDLKKPDERQMKPKRKIGVNNGSSFNLSTDNENISKSCGNVYDAYLQEIERDKIKNKGKETLSTPMKVSNDPKSTLNPTGNESPKAPDESSKPVVALRNLKKTLQSDGLERQKKPKSAESGSSSEILPTKKKVDHPQEMKNIGSLGSLNETLSVSSKTGGTVEEVKFERRFQKKSRGKITAPTRKLTPRPNDLDPKSLYDKIGSLSLIKDIKENDEEVPHLEQKRVEAEMEAKTVEATHSSIEDVTKDTEEITSKEDKNPFNSNWKPKKKPAPLPPPDVQQRTSTRPKNQSPRPESGLDLLDSVQRHRSSIKEDRDSLNAAKSSNPFNIDQSDKESQSTVKDATSDSNDIKGSPSFQRGALERSTIRRKRATKNFRENLI